MTQIIMHIPHRQQYARTHSLSAALNIILNWKLENVLLHQKIFPNLKFFSFFKKKIKEVLIKLAFGTKIDLSSCWGVVNIEQDWAGRNCYQLYTKEVNDPLLAADSDRSSALLRLDLRTAFDTVDHTVLLDRQNNFSGISGQWLNSHPSKRSFPVLFNNTLSEPCVMKHGIPQEVHRCSHCIWHHWIRSCSLWNQFSLLCRPSYQRVTCVTFFHLRNIAKIRLVLSLKHAAILIHAFVTSRLDYCNALFPGCQKQCRWSVNCFIVQQTIF